ncbi:MAG: DUF4399 domain-containing protein [Verrucomicrobiota bacterium]|nr:DUF4399 domain-containing protein [Verrucomicrobiota bacterium]MED6299939.1 DUF4399 domain-containing protein [Verrucomicrobiota bacterium]
MSIINTIATATLILITSSILSAEESKEPAPKAEPKMTSPKGAKAYIIFPKDGKTVKKKFLVRFGLKKMGIAPAGIKFPNTGHHHLIIDGTKFDTNLPLPMSETLKHFGAGQTETFLELKPGKHTLKLVFADHLHRVHEPPVISEEITITVKE